ncbi:Chymotrypsin-like elastase member 2A [Coemansia sp. RSA 2708]|nr:Chymotrypsin-like elastase member 2A [Coemansia sp. RSA 2708]
MVRTAYALALVAQLAKLALGDERIIGGTQAPSGMFPFIVHLFKDGNAYCGGTLIDSEWVLTAAHCVTESDSGASGAGSFTPINPGSFKVGYGTNGGSLGDYVEVDSIVVSTGFDPVWYTSDIALVKVKSNNDLISKAKSIAVTTADISSGQTVITAGWGQTTNDNTDQSTALMYAGLVVADDATCGASVPDWNGQNGRFVCTSFSTAPGIGTCYGDSGGPLLLSTGGGYTLLGIVSFDINTKDSSNTRCAQDGNISYFTRVSSYLAFISSTTGIAQSTLTGASSPWSHNAESSGSKSSSSPDGSSASGSSSDSSSSSKSESGSDSSSSSDKPADKKNDDGKGTDKSSTVDDQQTDESASGKSTPDASDAATHHTSADFFVDTAGITVHADDSSSDTSSAAILSLAPAALTLSVLLSLF